MIRTRHDIPEVSILRLEPGTVVRLKPKEWYYNHPNKDRYGRLSERGNPTFNSEMVGYLGREAVVRSVKCNGTSEYVLLKFADNPFYPERPGYWFGMNCIESIVS